MCTTNQNAVNQHKEAALLKAANELLKANNTVTTLELKIKLRKDASDYYWDQTTVSTMMAALTQQNKFTYIDNGTYRVYSGTKARVGKVVTKTVPTGLAVAQKRGRGRPRKAVAMTGQATAAVTPIPTPTPVIPVKRGRGRPRKNPIITVTTNPVPVVVQAPRWKKTVSRSTAATLLENSKGQIFTAVFIKRDGNKRTMNCQYMKDQVQSKLGFIKVKETSKLRAGVQPIRTVDLRTLQAFSLGRTDYKISG